MRKWYPLSVVILATLMSVVVYPTLPDRVPTHWDAHGNVNDYSPRFVGAFLIPMIMLGTWGLMQVLPKIDPRRDNYAKMRGAYAMVINATLTMLFVVHAIVLAMTLGAPFSLTRVLPALLGGMFVVIGNVLPQARPNWFFGIRTPWTLSNDRVWRRTHRIAGYLFVACGLLMVASAAFPVTVAFPMIFAGAMIAAFGSVIFSFIAWKQESQH
jgi:uncharacterized membrane protein